MQHGDRCPVHPVKDNSFSDRRRGTRQERGYDAEWDRQRALVMARDQGLCQPCLKGERFPPESEPQPSRVTRARAVDHVVSKAQAKRLGWTREETDAESNLQAICHACHAAKTALDGRAGARPPGGGGVGMFTRLVAGPSGS